MFNKKYYLTFITAILFFTTCIQTSAVENDFGSWNTIYLTTPITEKFKVNLESGFRYLEGDSSNNTIVRPSLGYELKKGLGLWLGYGYFDYDRLGDFLENRIWQQIQYDKEFSKLLLTTRFRLEERFFTETDIDDFSFGGRYLLRLMFPLKKINKKLSFVLSNEIFFNFNDAVLEILSDGYNQNRAFVGLNYKLNDHVMLEAGYQLQHLNLPSDFFGFKIPDRLNHGVLVNLFISTPSLTGKVLPKHFTMPPL